MYKVLLCWRYLRTRYLAMVCIVSVMLGVATLIVVNSVMSGFSTKLRERLHGLLSDCATKVIFNQEPGEIPLLQKHLGLSSTEVEYVRSLGRAWALWRVGERSFVVKLDVQPAEWAIVDTDGAMRGEVLDGPED